jgi:hypothetical protein
LSVVGEAFCKVFDALCVADGTQVSPLYCIMCREGNERVEEERATHDMQFDEGGRSEVDDL